MLRGVLGDYYLNRKYPGPVTRNPYPPIITELTDGDEKPRETSLSSSSNLSEAIRTIGGYPRDPDYMNTDRDGVMLR